MKNSKSSLRSLCLFCFGLIALTPITVVADEIESESVAEKGAAQQEETKKTKASKEADKQKESVAQAELQYSKWSDKINVPDPVAISFDNQGRAYVTQTQRRKSQDLDIRQNQDWIPNDLSFQSVEDKKNFYLQQLDPDKVDPKARNKRVPDLNKDGQHDVKDLRILSEKIHRLSDIDGDGKADKFELFSAGFRTEVTGILAGVLAHEGSVYATVAPDVWKLTDTDNDGRADTRQVMAHGFGVHIAYAGHDMHGLTVGPDGRIYWSVGDKGISVKTYDGREFRFPNQGGVMRCDINGQNFEVFAHGLRNVQELAFDQFGNLFGVDNDADQPNERERFVSIVEGMDAGWRCNYQYRGGKYNPWTREKLWETYFEDQPAYIIPPLSHSINGPAGFAFNPGTALSPAFKDYFFLTGAPGGQQIAFQVQPDGAKFKMVNRRKVGNGIPLVGINFAPDGGLYGVDWGGGYPLNQMGAVWKIDDPNHANSEKRTEVKTLLASGVKKFNDAKLLNLLGHEDQRVRLAAQFEMVNRERAQKLGGYALDQERPLLGRIHAIWGLGQSFRLRGNRQSRSTVRETDFLEELLRDPNEEILFQALRTAQEFPKFRGRIVRKFLNSDSDRIVKIAAMALGKLKDSDSRDEIIQRAAKLTPDQTYLRHAFSMALAGCCSERELGDLSKHESECLRICSVVALRMKKSPMVSKFLGDQSNWVAAESARAIHDDFTIPEAIPELALIVEGLQGNSSKDSKSDAFVLRAINANYLLGTPECALRLARYVADPNQSQSNRIFALKLLEQWGPEFCLDSVTGRYRDFSKQKRNFTSEKTLDSLKESITKILQDPNGTIQSAALRISTRSGVNVSEETLQSLVSSEKSNEKVRISALELIAKSDSKGIVEAIQMGLASKRSSLRQRALQLLCKRSPEMAATEIEKLLDGKTPIRERQNAISQLRFVGNFASRSLQNLWKRALNSEIEKDDSEDAVMLELIETTTAILNQSQKHDPEMVNFLKTSLESHRAKAESIDDKAKRKSYLMYGGDASKGKDIFQNHISAQCARCHKIGKKGSTVGPDLTKIAGTRDSLHLLRAILAPSADIDAKYRMQLVTLYSGQTRQGVLLSKNKKEIRIADTNGKTIKIATDDIEDQSELSESIMPDMKDVISDRQVRDLVEYLKTLR